MSTTQVAQQQQVAQQEAANTTAAQQEQVNVLDVEVKDENTALNIMVTFLNAAQRRGAYSMPESAKLWECVRVFQKQQALSTPVPSTTPNTTQ
jgi:hypothetical protein